MYGVPLTVYLFSSWLGSLFPALRATHSGGHRWNDLIGWQGDPHVSPFHLASYVVLVAGFFLIAIAWSMLLGAARAGQLGTTGPYAWVRHPQYLGFLAIIVGFLIQWPTIPTLLRLARQTNGRPMQPASSGSVRAGSQPGSGPHHPPGERSLGRSQGEDLCTSISTSSLPL